MTWPRSSLSQIIFLSEADENKTQINISFNMEFDLQKIGILMFNCWLAFDSIQIFNFSFMSPCVEATNYKFDERFSLILEIGSVLRVVLAPHKVKYV